MYSNAVSIILFSLEEFASDAFADSVSRLCAIAIGSPIRPIGVESLLENLKDEMGRKCEGKEEYFSAWARMDSFRRSPWDVECGRNLSQLSERVFKISHKSFADVLLSS